MRNADLESLLEEFGRSLDECQRLYLTSGQECVEQYPHLLTDSPREFLQMMGDLHKGLLVKLYITVSQADRRWSVEEQRLAEILLQHLWRRRLTGQDLRTAIVELSRQSDQLNWYSLIRPFDQLAPLRDRVGELETLVMRIANLIAKAEGEVLPAEADCLRRIQEELHQHLHRLPLDEPGHHSEADVLGRQAVQSVKADSEPLRQPLGSTPERASEECELKPRPQLLAEALQRLDAMIGMDNIKDRVRTLANFIHVQQERERAGLPRTPISLHMVFHGNPGTGKTTVARIVGQVFGAMGVLEKGHLVETDRSGLVASYAGQTAPKANKKIDEALDGVLFIDEAYSLVADAAEDAFGQEALQTLLKRMEDDRQRLIVILAGYPHPMDRLLKSNPGLSSRFGTRLTFEDYTPTELARIFQAMCEKNHYVFPWQVQAKLLLGLEWLYEQRDEHFGNGRLVRNLFENAIRRLANRIAGIAPLTKELLTNLDPDDIDFDEVPAEVVQRFDDPNLRFAVVCQGCGASSRLPGPYLGRRVKCNKCDHRFVADWGLPQPSDS